MKHCIHCGVEKPLAEFSYSPAKGRHSGSCRGCSAAASKRWRESPDNRERSRIADSRKRREKPELYAEMRRRGRQRYDAAHPGRSMASHEEWKRRNPTSQAWSSYRNVCAQARSLEFSLPRPLFDDLITDNCFYCGASPEPANGIDRVDNALGYVDANVVTCCAWCNRAKHVRSRENFEAWVLRAAAHLSKFRQVAVAS